MIVNSPVFVIIAFSREGNLFAHQTPKSIVESFPLLCLGTSSILAVFLFCFVICAFEAREPGSDLSVQMAAVDAASSIGSAHDRSARAAAASGSSPYNYQKVISILSVESMSREIYNKRTTRHPIPNTPLAAPSCPHRSHRRAYTAQPRDNRSLMKIHNQNLCLVRKK